MEKWKDPIIEEIRKIREEHAAKFNYDLDAIVEDVKKCKEELIKHGWKFISISDMDLEASNKQKKRKKK